MDFELAVQPDLAERVNAAAHQAGVGVIRSWHDFSSTPAMDELRAILPAMQEAGAEVAKVAVMPLGTASRLCGGHFGSGMTFAAGDQASAPGQADLDLVRRCLAALGLAQQSHWSR